MNSISPRKKRSPQGGSGRKTGFTLLELTIGISIFAMIMLGMYAFIRQGNRASSNAYTRQALVNQSNNIMKQMQEDFRMAASAAITLTGNQSEIQVVQRVNDKDSTVTYRWDKPKLVRKAVFNGKTTIHQFTDKAETFSVEKKLRPVIDETSTAQAGEEQVVIRLGLSANVPGETKPLSYDQHAMATMRNVAAQKYDPHWRDVGNMKGVFSHYGDLLSSLKSDADLFIEDLTSTIDNIVEDAKNAAEDVLNQNKGNLLEAKDNLTKALGDIAKGRVEINTSLDDMEATMKGMPNDIFQREFKKIGTWGASKGDAKKRVADAFMKMKTVEDCDVKKLESAAKPFKLNEAFRSFLDSKRKALQNRNDMDKKEGDLKELMGKLDSLGKE